MHPSIPAAKNHPTPPPSRGYYVAFTRLVSPGEGGGAFANFALPGGHAFTNPGVIPKLLTRMQFPIRLTTQRILLEKQAHWLICQGPEKLKRVFKACSRFHACFFPLHIKSESHGEIGSYQDVNQRFLDKLKLNQISVDIIWRKFFHIYKTIRIATRQVSTKRLVLYFNDFRIKQVRY